MVSYSSAVSINRSAAQIFPYLLEATIHKTEEDLRNGSVVDVCFGVGVVKMVVGIQISSLELGRKLAFRPYSGPVRWSGEYSLVDNGAGGTTVKQRGELKFKGLWRLWQPIAGGQIKRGEVKELLRLKERVEAIPALV